MKGTDNTIELVPIISQLHTYLQKKKKKTDMQHNRLCFLSFFYP